MNAGTTIEATFCFVDIAAYTALTDSHGEHAAADLVDQFGELIQASIKSSGRLQSLIGYCKMQVDTRRAAGDLHFGKRTYWFCSLTCVERFAREPSSFVSMAKP